MDDGSRFRTKNSFVEEQIREALRKLEAQGLLTLHPHRGAQVSGLDLADFVEVYRIRAALEGLATRLAIVKSDETEHAVLVAALEAVNERMVVAERDDDGAAWRQANRAFHSTMCSAAGAPRLEQLIRNLWATFPWDTRTFVPQCAGRAEQEHETILEAVRQRDAERASALMTEHIETAAGALRTYVESSSVSLRQLIHAQRTPRPAENS